jgi:hypothetical protein
LIELIQIIQIWTRDNEIKEDKVMNGYVKNKTASWRHALKRSIGPGHQVDLDELYEQYGKKHDLEEGKPFVEWLRSVKLPDNTVWEIVYDDGKPKAEIKESKKVDMVMPHVKKPLDVKDIVTMSVRQARQDLKKITDIKLLKYALGEARQLANKDTLCIMLRRRIQELELTRR